MSYFLNKFEDLPLVEVFPGVTGRLFHTDTCTIAEFYFAAGTELPLHHHLHEQTSTVLEGVFVFQVNDESRHCQRGDIAHIPSNVPHSGRALTDCRIQDVFTPVREDYRALGKQ